MLHISSRKSVLLRLSYKKGNIITLRLLYYCDTDYHYLAHHPVCIVVAIVWSIVVPITTDHTQWKGSPNFFLLTSLFLYILNLFFSISLFNFFLDWKRMMCNYGYTKLMWWWNSSVMTPMMNFLTEIQTRTCWWYSIRFSVLSLQFIQFLVFSNQQTVLHAYMTPHVPTTFVAVVSIPDDLKKLSTFFFFLSNLNENQL